jgi:phosphatidylinositol alpha 1,6-mannosyltransferase
MTGSAADTLVGWHPRFAAPRRLRVLVVTESFLPQVNGVTNSVRRVLDHLADAGHAAELVAPSGPDVYAGAPVHRVASVAMPAYRDFPLGLASRHTLRRIVDRFRPDVVHLASPALLGRAAGAVARELGVPVVAVYQTDLIGFAERYPFPGAAALMRRLTTSIHRSADLNLVPSTASLEQFDALRIGGAVVWPRGVDSRQFNPARRSEELRRGIGARRSDVLVGYVGRLAAEKELELLTAVQHLPDTQLVVIGDGPERGRLERELPTAHFTGQLQGAELARAFASLDVFVHTGSTETFCQAAQEALVSGVPVVAPDAGGLRDLVTPGVNGLLYTPGDRGDLYASVEALVRDGWLRTRMGAAAATGCRDRSWRSVNEALIDHYWSLAGHVQTREAG